MTRPPETARLKLWTWLLPLLFAAGLWCRETRGAVKGADTYETPPPNTNTIKWEENQRLQKARQELYRKRITIAPDATAPDAPRDNSLNADKSPQMTALAAPPATPGRNQRLLFYMVLLAVAAVFALRKFAPEVLADLNQRFNPLATAPEPQPRRLGQTAGLKRGSMQPAARQR